MPKDKFTINKQKVREMDLKLIARYLHDLKGNLRYLGLPASNMIDLIMWKDYFSYFCAIERGKPGKEHIEQHNLMLTAMQYGFANRLHLLRGDIDDILLKGKDDYNNPILYPFDVVSLDYSGDWYIKME